MRLTVIHRLTVNHHGIGAVRAEALFISMLQPSQHPGHPEVQQAVIAAIRQFGSRECAARVAEEFGEHPEIAAARMRWARGAVTEAFRGPRLPEVRRGRHSRHLARHAA